MSVNDFISGFLKPNHTYDIKYDGQVLEAKVVDKDKAIATNYSTNFQTIKHEAFTQFKCGENTGYCNNHRACNKEGKCGSFETHFNQNEPNNKYRLCISAIDKNCIDKVICNNNSQCVPLFRV